MDRTLSHQEQSRYKIRDLLPFVLVIAFLVGGYLLATTFLSKKGDASEFHIVTVERGAVLSTLSAMGTVIAASERVINAPISTEIEDVFKTIGDNVKKGDRIIKLDQEYTALEYERLEDELGLRINNLQKLSLQYEKDIRDLDYRNQIKALQLEELSAELADQKKLQIIGGATKEQVEAATLKLNIGNIEKKVLENELSFKQQINNADKRNLQLEFDIQQKRLLQLEKKLNETIVNAPSAGVITWINEDIGKTVAEGEPLVRIANLKRFEIEATTSDRNSKQLAIGLPVEVRINKEKLMGHIARVLPEIVNNTVKFFVLLDNPSHVSLRPNLRTEIYIITSKKEDVLRAKKGQALKGGQQQEIYKVEDNIARKVRIKRGLISSQYFEIIDGLKEGDRLIISNTKDFDHMDQFEINY